MNRCIFMVILINLGINYRTGDNVTSILKRISTSLTILLSSPLFGLIISYEST